MSNIDDTIVANLKPVKYIDTHNRAKAKNVAAAMQILSIMNNEGFAIVTVFIGVDPI